MKNFVHIILCLCLLSFKGQAQIVNEFKDSVVLSTKTVSVTFDRITGKVNYRFTNGSCIYNSVAYINESRDGRIASADLKNHKYTIRKITGNNDTGIELEIKHDDGYSPFYLLQHIKVYSEQSYLRASVEAVSKTTQTNLATNNISPLAVLPSYGGNLVITGKEPRILDVPFDNDDWVPVLERQWKEDKHNIISGTSYEYSAIYDNSSLSAIVIGSISHDFWKTGIAYRAASQIGQVDSLNVYGGAATPDDPSLPAAYGGRDGTHDVVAHGMMEGNTVSSPEIYISGGGDLRKELVQFGKVNADKNGSLTWKGFAPVYWNSFGVENVLGHTGIMMPNGVGKISNFIHTLNNFNKYSPPVLSIDSYDQGIYTTELLASLGKYGKARGQQMGFYFIPFALWTWKKGIEKKQLPGTDFMVNDVALKDLYQQPIAYKNGDFGAFALDPTHPAIRQYIINQLIKAKTINATFLKIDFLTAGALESSTRYNPSIHSGMQAYNYGMKMLKHLIDSIMGPDIFITMAISPMFPSQYAHTRFISTDVYSHLRDDEAGFPKWGSTEASLATGSHSWWVQGTLWPYTNMDVTIMSHFQKNPVLSEQEVKVRLYALITMGSILGDGSDYREMTAAERAEYFLNNKNVCSWFSHPKAFTPIKMADGETFNQQLSFYLPSDTVLVSMFNFDTARAYTETFSCRSLGLKRTTYEIHDFLTDSFIGYIKNDQPDFKLTVLNKDALLIKLVPVIK